jgi:hypothetical protein
MTESSARLRRPVLRRPEKHQLGYNTIYLPGAEPLPARAVSEAASLLKLKETDLERIVSEGVPLPVARMASREEAELILDRLQELGFRVLTLVDEGFVKRVKSMACDESQLVINAGHPRDEVVAPWSNVVMLVPARLTERRVEVKEVTTRRAENEILDTSEFFSDETVIAIY